MNPSRHTLSVLLRALVLATCLTLSTGLAAPAGAALDAAAPAGTTSPAGTAAPPGTSVRWPLSPRPAVVRGFEPPPQRWLPGHRGVDLAGQPGQAVHAAATGTVSFAGRLAGRGVVVVSHGATRTTYEPVVAAVRTGAVVSAGAVLGQLSAVGSHCAPRACLHWGLLRGEEYLDPLAVLGAAPVRLLPSADRGARAPSAPEVATARNVAGATTAAAGATAGPTGTEAAERRAPDGSSNAARAAVGLVALAAVACGLLVSRH